MNSIIVFLRQINNPYFFYTALICYLFVWLFLHPINASLCAGLCSMGIVLRVISQRLVMPARRSMGDKASLLKP